ncbi:AN1-type zinc finger protein 2A-like protein [Aphelenchoides besseyi]|nr:AN1-type zinc finger protein 2A-like protein [Aphelenchoides besseyi]KAI6201813.1 AN1-type zinc finger protein 2A-like protein [Aphelenchoides besseyi]
MAEFPTLGGHCAHEECNQLDFLPMKCNGCSKEFCSRHFTYENHNCSSGLRLDVQVPVCPLCNTPVPTAKNEIADVVVGAHIDNDCQSDPARRKRAYVNACSLKRCKRRELVPVLCTRCRRNFCIKHRHEGDHECKGLQFNPMLKPSPDNMTDHKPMHSTLRSDEELARALQQKLNTTGAQYDPLEMDRQLAAQLQREEYRASSQVGGETSGQRRSGQCLIS